MRYYLILITLITSASLLPHSTPEAPLQAEPVQAFIHLMSSTRNANSHSVKSKELALRTFNQLYADGNYAIRELLGHFTAALTSILHQKMLPPDPHRKLRW